MQPSFRRRRRRRLIHGLSSRTTTSYSLPSFRKLTER